MAEQLDDLDSTSAKINVTPLVDVCLVLVLFFMVTMPLSVIYGVRVRQEALAKYGLTTPQENITVTIKTNAILVSDGKNSDKKIPSVDFGMVLGEMLQLSTAKQVMFKVDPLVPHGLTVWALDTAKQRGAEGVSFIDQGA